MFGNEVGQIADRLEARIFRQVRAFEAFIVMDCPFFGVRQRRRRQHSADLGHHLIRRRRVDPAPVQAAIIVGGKTGHIDTGAGFRCGCSVCRKGG